MKKILLITILFLSQLLTAQDKGTLKGFLTDKETNNESLPFANVIIKGTTTGTTTDFDGLYSIQVPAGRHIVVFSFLGYKSVEKAFTIKSGETVTINQLLSAEEGVALDDIIITTTTTKNTANALLLEQKKATVIKESIGSVELAKQGVSDAAGAVTKISGVSKQEGSNNVYVRGLGDRYLNTTMNGLSLPSNDVNKKNIDLTLFPSDVIQSVSISKAYSPEFYGDFAAGNIDITSKEYKGDSFFDVSVGSGVNTRAADKDFRKTQGSGQLGFYRRYAHNPFAVVLSHGVDPENGGTPVNIAIGLSGGKSFNFKDDSRLSLFGTASFQNGYEYREGPVVDFTNVYKVRYPNAQEFEYSTASTVMGNAIYKINNNHKVKYTTMFFNSSSDQVGYYGVKGLGQNRDAILDTDRGFYQMNVQFNQDLIFVNQLTGEHNFYDYGKEDPTYKLTWGVGYNNVFAHEPDRKRISLENYQYALDSDPNTNASFFSNTVFDNQRYFQKIIDEELNSRINLEHTISETFTLNYGYNGRIKKRDFENIRYGYDFNTPRLQVADPNNLDAVFNVENFGTVYNTEVFNSIAPGRYGTTNFPGANENTYNGELEIHAGFISAVLLASEKLSIVPGVRVEAFSQQINYDVININPNDPKFRQANETFILPSLNIKYALNDNQNLRFTFSKTVSVPEFKEVAPFVYEAVSQRVGGNPDLLNDPSFSEVFNLDLKYEWFLSRGEILSLSTFGKQINNPINLVIANDATGTQRYFRTGDKATVLGVEFEGRKNFITNDDDETQLSAGFNFTYMHTKQDLKDVNGLFSANFNRASDQLQGASPILLNANLTYSPTKFENYKPIASIVFSYFSDRIDALGAGQLGNIIEKSVSTLDFVFKNQIGENIEINLNARNLLDPNITRLRENTSLGDVILSEYQIGRTISIGFNYKF
ncbi:MULTISPECIES: TonB-dependent receptor [unclassified Polaribacter]|uniref:TonB-dependent receptor n=1 Tax=unclassified Polaribacter TaxID=196858 RepID=UPI0011BD9F6B|nr:MULTISPECIES: TonB-dependent receptor [unclassified Polaribacter]TXD52215.1 TonB-dependent receptor [Polaribacter sp. IC063]TXD60071.1 TonB-dependent receptor [Polaribacter sp. IC066]